MKRLLVFLLVLSLLFPSVSFAAWTAEKTAVTKNLDLISITVRFTDGVKTFTRTYKYRGVPPADWLELQVDQILKDTEALEGANISIGPVDKPKPVVIP